MEQITLDVLLVTAVSIGFLHTVIGIDHALPFVALGKARGWNLSKTLLTTLVCGVGHVLGSVILGIVGIGLGVALDTLEFIEGFRGEVTAWLIIGFGLAYATWGMVQLNRNKSAHSHVHVHADGTVHTHHHTHADEHAHPHLEDKRPVSQWALFVIFVFGPCEALIPMLMAPAAEHNWLWVGLVTTAFGVTTVLTMLGMVAIGYLGLNLTQFKGIERYANVAAGLAIATGGAAIQVLGI